jgi:parallel beta-helix repeat protein
VVNNLFSNVRNGVYVGGGRDNIVRHNLFFSSDPSIHFDARGLDDQAMITGIGPTLQRRLTEVPIDSPVYRERFPELARIRDEQPMAPLGNRIADNVIVDGTPLFLLGPSPKKFLDGPVGERLSVRSAKAWHGRPQRQWIALLEARVPEAAQYFPWDEFEAANRKGQAAR